MPLDGPSNAEDDNLRGLLARIRAGDEAAARELLARYEPQVRLVVRRRLPRILRSRFDSIDFLQSVWGDFFRRLRAGANEFEDPTCLVAFLARAARNKVIDQYRRAGSLKKDIRREEPLWSEGGRPREVADNQDSPSDVAEAREAFRQLRNLLPEGRRQVLDLKAEGYTYREIGERMGLSERTVRRILEELKRRAAAEGQGA